MADPNSFLRTTPVEVVRVEKKMPLCPCGFQADCLVPDGDGAVAMCWMCAHYATEHPEAPPRAPLCDCAYGEIYPKDVIDLQYRRRLQGR